MPCSCTLKVKIVSSALWTSSMNIHFLRKNLLGYRPMVQQHVLVKSEAVNYSKTKHPKHWFLQREARQAKNLSTELHDTLSSVIRCLNFHQSKAAYSAYAFFFMWGDVCRPHRIVTSHWSAMIVTRLCLAKCLWATRRNCCLPEETETCILSWKA